MARPPSLPAASRPPLSQAIRDPGFTPRARDLDALVDLLTDEALVKDAERAIGRLGPAAVERLVARYRAATGPLRARVLRAIGRHPALELARATLLEALADADPKARRNAAVALGHVPGGDVERALLGAWDSDPRPEMRRTLAASLGKIGSAAAASLLVDAAASSDPELARVAARASMMVGRTASRAERGRIDPARPPPAPVDVVLTCRRGLEDVLAEELAPLESAGLIRGVRPAGAGGSVRARLVGSLGAMLGVRTALSVSLPLATEWVRDGDTLEEAVTRAITSDAARALLATWTVGAARYRLAWAGAGHKRAATWNVAQAVARRAPELVNDPTESLWEIVVTTQRRFVEVVLMPHADDPRFAWRVGDVPAASHPTVAAALARVAGVGPDDVVWDPFVGSGAELVERALLGPARELVGSDLDPRALAVARANLAAARVPARLELGGALELSPPGVTLVITNPPMGRRASRVAGLDQMLDRFLAHAASVLVPGGRLVWIAPWPERSRAAASRAGLRLDWARTIDMGGFDAEMQRLLR